MKWWTNREEDRVRQWAAEGLMVKTIAYRLDRTTHAITRKMRDLGIKPVSHGISGRVKLNLWFSEAQFDKISTEAASSGMSKSQLVRNLVAKHFNG